MDAKKLDIPSNPSTALSDWRVGTITAEPTTTNVTEESYRTSSVSDNLSGRDEVRGTDVRLNRGIIARVTC